MIELLDALSVSASVTILIVGAAVLTFTTVISVTIAVSETFE